MSERAAYDRFAAADIELAAEVARVHPHLENARYLPAARGTEGSELRRLYEVRRQAQAEWESAFDARLG